jgi:uncharacterized Zn-binding protein involved in type VI secretion
MLFGVGSCGALHGATYYVSTSGVDSSGRDGSNSSTQAWKTLAYAASRVAAGTHTIRLGAGTFQETTQTVVKSGWTIEGNGSSGSSKTRIQSPTTWNSTFVGLPTGPDYILKVRDGENVVSNVTVKNIEFADSGPKKANGAIYAYKARNLRLDNLVVLDFYYAGVYIERESGQVVSNCWFQNSATSSLWSASKLGQLTTLWTSNINIYGNTFKTTYSNGYGYRGRGHTGAYISGNTFDIYSPDFDIEIAHDHEYGVYIYENRFKNVISVPKQSGQSNPGNWNASVWISRNYSTSGEFVEGARGWLEVSHNFVEPSTGHLRRFYTNYGSSHINTGTWCKIHHNVVVGNPMAFVYFQNGAMQAAQHGMEIYNNTVFMTSTGTAPLIDFNNSTGQTSDGWKVKNNIFIMPSGSRAFLNSNALARLTNYSITNNVCQNITNMPAGNYTGTPTFKNLGKKPYPYYTAQDSTSPQLNRGTYVGFPYAGSNPDCGAFGWNLVPWGWWVVAKARHSGRLIDVSSASTADGANVQQYGTTTQPHRNFLFSYLGSGYYSMTARHSGKMLAVSGASTADGANVIQSSASTANHFQWAPVGLDGTYFRITNRNSGKSMDVKDASTADGAQIQQWNYGGQTNAQWSFESP